MKHTILYRGHISLNFNRLRSDTTKYVTVDGMEMPEPGKLKSVDGIAFGYMEGRGKEFFAVSVENVILDAPIRIDTDRHTDGKGFPPQGAIFGDESAQRLLADILRANPSRAEEIVAALWSALRRS
jgi:hypothetical protein